MSDDRSTADRESSAEPNGQFGQFVALFLLGCCFVVAVAVVLAWGSWLLSGTGLGFVPATVLALVVLSVFAVAGLR